MKLNSLKNKVISGIYKINYPNGKAYIGQARNIYKRLKEHNNYSIYGHGEKELLLCEKKMKEYNFLIDDFDLLEEVSDFSKLDIREAYWIGYYKTYVKDGCGYNLTRGGDCSNKYGINHTNAIFDEKTLNEIIDLLQNHTELSYIDIANRYNVDKETIRRISAGISYINPNLHYPLRRYNHDSLKKETLKDYNLTEKSIIELKEDLKYRWDLTLDFGLYKKWNIPVNILRDINQGRIFQEYGKYSYPIRVNKASRLELSISDIKDILNLLKNSNLSMEAIGKQYNVSRATIRKINKGQEYQIKDFPYPARLTK